VVWIVKYIPTYNEPVYLNTKKVRFVCSNGNTSKHNVWVEFYSGKTKTKQTKRIALEDLKPIDTSNPYNFSRDFQGIPNGTCSAGTFKLKEGDYNYIKGTTYAKTITEPAKGCTASTQIATK